MVDYLSKFKLKSKISVVSGGLGLIGQQISLALAQAGSKVLVLDIGSGKGKAFEKECKENNLDVEFIEFDLTKIKDYKSALEDLYKKEGKIDVWVNVAYPRTSDWGHVKLEDLDLKSWQENVDIQMNSYCMITKTIAELMKQNKIKGSIINFSSTYGIVGPDFEVYSGTDMINAAPYSAIKGGIINFTRYVASYYGKYGIRVNCVCPGGIFNNQNPIFVKNYEKRTPLKRMGEPSEMATATLFLASDASSYVTGTNLMVDGGWTCI